MDLNLRKFAKFVDKTFIEVGKKAKEPVLLVSVAAVIKNPWIDKGFVEDLKQEILSLAPKALYSVRRDSFKHREK